MLKHTGLQKTSRKPRKIPQNPPKKISQQIQIEAKQDHHPPRRRSHNFEESLRKFQNQEAAQLVPPIMAKPTARKSLKIDKNIVTATTQIYETAEMKPSTCSITISTPTSDESRILPGNSVKDFNFATTNFATQKKSSKSLVKPAVFPTRSLPAPPPQENLLSSKNSRKVMVNKNLERGHPRAGAHSKLQIHTSPSLASDCQSASSSRPSLCSAQPGQPITQQNETNLAKSSLLGSVIGGRQ